MLTRTWSFVGTRTKAIMTSTTAPKWPRRFWLRSSRPWQTITSTWRVLFWSPTWWRMALVVPKPVLRPLPPWLCKLCCAQCLPPCLESSSCRASQPKNEDNEEEATINLSTMNSLFGKLPWHLSFSYGKALQRTCIVTWLGKTENKDAAQKALKARAKANSDACFGKYKAGSCRSLGPDDASSVPAGPYWGVSKWAAAKSLQVLRSTSRLQVPIPAMLSTGFSIATLNHQRVLIPGLVFGGLHLLQAH